MNDFVFKIKKSRKNSKYRSSFHRSHVIGFIMREDGPFEHHSLGYNNQTLKAYTIHGDSVPIQGISHGILRPSLFREFWSCSKYTSAHNASWKASRKMDSNCRGRGTYLYSLCSQLVLRTRRCLPVMPLSHQYPPLVLSWLHVPADPQP